MMTHLRLDRQVTISNGDRLVDIQRNVAVWKRGPVAIPDTPRPAIVKKVISSGGAP